MEGHELLNQVIIKFGSYFLWKVTHLRDFVSVSEHCSMRLLAGFLHVVSVCHQAV